MTQKSVCWVMAMVVKKGNKDTKMMFVIAEKIWYGMVW